MVDRLTAVVEVDAASAIAELSQLDALLADVSGTRTVDVNADVDVQGIDAATRDFDSMAASAADLEDDIDDASDAVRRYGDETEAATGRASGAFGNLRASIAAIGTVAVAAGFGLLIGQANEARDAAVNLGESVNAVNVIFGEAADEILEYGQNAAQAVGLANSEFNQLATNTGQLLQGFGLSASEAADATIRLTERSADLASVLNTDVGEALGAVNAALRGETEPIRRFIGDFSVAAIEAQAVADGIAAVGEELDPTQKALAAINLILGQSERVAGDFSNTSDELANRQRILAAEAENARAAIGEGLLPVYEALADALPEIIAAFETAAPSIASSAEGVADGIATVAGALDQVQQFASVAGLFQNIGSAIGTGLVAPFAALDELSTGNFEGFVDSFEASADRLARIESDFDFQRLIIGAQEAAQAVVGTGEEINRFADFLNEASQDSTLTEDRVRRLAAVFGLTEDELAAATNQVLLYNDAFANREGLAGAEALLAVLRDLAGVQDRFAGRETAGGRDLFTAVDPASIDGLVQGLAGADAAFENTQAVIAAFAASTDTDLQTVAAAFGGLADAQDFGAGLAEAAASLRENIGGAFVDTASLVDEETGKIIDDLDEIANRIEEDRDNQIEFEANLSTIFFEIGPEAARLAAEFGPEFAQALAEDPSGADAVQRALADQLSGGATEAAATLAQNLAQATPEQIDQFQTFAAENFLTPYSLGQVASVGETIGELISQNIVVNLDDVQFVGEPQVPTSQLTGGGGGTPPSGGGTSGGGSGGGGATYNFEIQTEINNPTSQDVSSGAAQLEQRLQAVASLLVR